MINLVCEVRFAQERHNEHLREAEQHRLLCSSTPKEPDLLSRWHALLMNRANTTAQVQNKHNHEGN